MMKNESVKQIHHVVSRLVYTVTIGSAVGEFIWVFPQRRRQRRVWIRVGNSIADGRVRYRAENPRQTSRPAPLGYINIFSAV